MLSAIVLALLLDAVVGRVPVEALESRVVVHLSIDQNGGLSARQLNDAIDQVRRIWSAVGIRVTAGRYGEPAPLEAATVSLRIVESGPRHRAAGPLPLAWVSLSSSGRPTPALFVSFRGVTALLSNADFRGRSLGDRPRTIRERIISQAIGRAAAHELGHYLLQTAAHRDVGLMRPTFSTEDLMGSTLAPFELPTIERRAVRYEIAMLAQLQAMGR